MVTSSRSFEDTALSYNRSVLVSDFDFELPPELIAQQPPAQRGESRMLAMSRMRGSLQDLWFTELPQLLREGDVLVLNDSRVIPARLFGTCPGKSGARQVEVLLTEQLSKWEWRALTRPARKMDIGQQVTFAAPAGDAFLEATVT
jgi:S-adenosylmethionine:tRNA ribosyltransferase-isomerase